MMKVAAALHWEAPGAQPREVDPLLLRLLANVAEKGSLQRAARDSGVSYRHAWGLIGDWSRVLDGPLLAARRGQGARLAPLGERLLRAQSRVQEKFAAMKPALEEKLAKEFPAPGPKEAGLRISASHDLALLRLKDFAPDSRWDLRFRGSLDALEDLGQGVCDVAGFHVRQGQAPDSRMAEFLRGFRLILFVRRTQGLLVASGNPKRIRTLGDLARPGTRFVNRQRGSGTRLLLDELLAREGIETAMIRGYEQEEFTHAAVAATIASGLADAGLGIQAAAQPSNLGFVALATEQYYLACPPTRLDSPPMRSLLELLRSPPVRQALKSLPGYQTTGCGRVIAPPEAWRHHR